MLFEAFLIDATCFECVPLQSDEMSKGSFNTFTVLILEPQMFTDQNSYGVYEQNETKR